MIGLQGSLLDLADEVAFTSLARLERTQLGRGAWVDHRPGWLQGSQVLFDRLAMHRVHAETDERNGAVHRLFERLGFREEGCLVEADWCKGEWVTLRLYAVLAREWSTRPRCVS